MLTNFSNRMSNVGQKISLPYIVFFELVLIFRMVSVYSTLPPRIDSIFTLLITFFSGILFISYFLPIVLQKKKVRIEYWLVLFVMILLISALVNHSYAFSENIKLIIWQCIFFFCVFEVGRKNDKRVFDAFERVLIFTWTILVVIGLYLFFARVNFSVPVDSLYYGMRIGFYENRLYGIFVDPNYACTVSLVCAVIALKNLWNTSYIWKKLLFISILLLQLSYVALSGSRSGTIQLVAATFFGLFFLCWYIQTKKNKSNFKKIASAILVSLFFSGIAFSSIDIIKNSYIQVANTIEVSKPKLVSKFEAETSSQKVSDKPLSAKRPDVVESNDVSNSRFDLWESAVELMRESPIFGTTPRGFVAFAKDKIPNTYIAKTGQTPHSAIFYLLAATGITGTIVFAVFIFIKIWKSLIILFDANKDNYIDFLMNNQIVLIILVSSLLITEIVLTRRSATFIFWLYLGKLQYGFDQEHKIKLK
ncbi:O-antigen ligase family protein [Enterococcus sp. DIV2381]|uniref:O-antigen ligase family protein n=2 Tax=Enterococcus TaxID=1350 RepID=UPI003D281024